MFLLEVYYFGGWREVGVLGLCFVFACHKNLVMWIAETSNFMTVL